MDSSKINFLWVNNQPNLGDQVCSPMLYFDEFRNGKRVPWGSNLDQFQYGPAIIGGGGLLCDGAIDQLQWVLQRKHFPFVLWGIGTNNPNMDFSYPDWMYDYDLVGIRDHPSRFEWVPCSSCMHPEFDGNHQKHHEVVSYLHFKPAFDFGIPSHHNYGDPKSVSRMIRFIGSAETVITDSYHGTYWAALLGRKVVLFEPEYTRFFKMPWFSSIANRDNWRQVIRDARSDGPWLDRCRYANQKFMEKVVDCIGA